MGRKKNKPNTKDLQVFETDILECRSSPLLGRHFVTKRPVKKGELLLREPWLVAGLTLNTSSLVCIGCHSNILAINNCRNCGWFVCGETCSKDSPFHTKEECNFLKENKIQVPKNAMIDYGVITVLRSLKLKLDSPEDWTNFKKLQSHNEERKRLPVWKHNKELVTLIRNIWNLGHLFTPEDIFDVCGILEVNGFEMGDGWSFEGVFLKSSMIAHDCIPNCSQSENIDDRVLEVSAIVDIPADTPLTLCYAGTLEGTRWRQLEIQKSKYFTCSCRRCQDPTELGTNFSSFICTDCKTGVVTAASVQNGGGETNWSCSKCPKILTDENADAICLEFKQLRKSMDTTVSSLEEFLKKCSHVFHQNHFIPFKVKFDLCLAYGHDEGFNLDELSPGQVARKLELCTSVMKVLDILCTGQSVARGNILYEIQAAQVLTVRHCVASEKCSRRLLQTRLKTAMGNLTEAIDIFQVHYSLRMLAKNATEVTLVELKEWQRKF